MEVCKRKSLHELGESMAVVVESIIASILENIGGWFIQKAVSAYGVGARVKSIKTELELMKAFLKDADGIEREGHGKVFKALVAEMRDAAYEAEDAIEMYISTERSNRQRAFISDIFKRRTDVAIFRDVDEKIENVKKAIDDIRHRRSVYAPPQASRSGELRDREDAAFAEDEDVIGFDGNADELVQKLTSSDTHRRVVSIVAVGGAGKTTLAYKVYKDGLVRSHFRCGWTAWTSLSQTRNAEETLQDIAEQVMDMPVPLNSKVLQHRLSEFLKKKKYLIVLDNVWQTDQWDELKGAFPDVGNGSRIMITTRRRSVALYAGSVRANCLYELPPLSSDDSLNLLLKKANSWAPTDQLTCTAEPIESQILAKCYGFPIAIKLIGEQLAKTDRRRKDWENVFDSLERHLFDCSKILAFYYDLPPHLKPCFLSFSLFPQSKIDAEKLKMVWVTEGFIEEGEEGDKENIAEGYLKELMDSSIIQVERREWDGTVVTCGIHGLLRDLAILEAKQHHFLGIDNQSASLDAPLLQTVRRLSIKDKIFNIHNRIFLNVIGKYPSYSTPKLRTFLCFAKLKLNLTDTKLLRVLDLEGVNVPENVIQAVIEKSIYLKYLNLKNASIKNLPLSYKHCNLETLLLPNRTRLPKAIWKMERLRYLYYFGLEFEGSPQFDCLRSLQTLHLQAGNWIENNLSSLIDLRKLHIRGDESSNLDVLWRSIEQLTLVQSLVLEFSSKNLTLSSLERHSNLNEMLLMVGLERLPRVQEFPPTLTKLSLQDSKLKEDPMSTLGELKTLECLRLGRDSYCGKTMTSAGFPVLRCLRLERLIKLEELLVGEGSMPRLESLQIEGCESLIRRPERLQHITTPRELRDMRVSSNFSIRHRENVGEVRHKNKRHCIQ